jgi:diphthamide biosynthesis protein 7
MDSSKRWIDKIDTRLNACSLETLYTPLKNHTYPLVIGCYQLNEGTPSEENIEGESKKPSRSGELIMHRIDANLKFGNEDEVQIIDTDSGVLDGKWLQSGPFYVSSAEDVDNKGYMFATSNASGSINLYQLEEKDEEIALDLKHVAATNADADANGLALSLAWDESKYRFGDDGTCASRIVSSYSKGSLAIHDIVGVRTAKEHIECSETQRWDAHTLFGCAAEVWTVCFASNRHYNTYADTVISGGDDCKMKLWDLRMTAKPTSTKTGFDAGVTAVAYHPTLEHVFAVGSYDENVRIFDMRKISGEPLANIHVGGGVWRVKWHPTDESRILVGAMHGGCRIVDVPSIVALPNSDDCIIDATRITKEFTEHESMAYGADWISDEDNYEAAVSCSFYDRKAFIWNSSSDSL